jgi:hypothetical protein
MYNYGMHDDETSHVRFAHIATQLRVFFSVNNYGNLIDDSNLLECYSVSTGKQLPAFQRII